MPGTAAWLWLCALLAAGAAAVGAASLPLETLPAWLHRLDWHPLGELSMAWRAFSAAWVHWSALHLGANLLGLGLLALLGSVARCGTEQALAWLLAWPLTQLGLLLQPQLTHYGGLSGVLHAGVAVAALHLMRSPNQLAARRIGMALAAGALAKVLLEQPWGPALRHWPGWDIPIAPLAHASGLVSGGVGYALVARVASALARRAQAGKP